MTEPKGNVHDFLYSVMDPAHQACYCRERGHHTRCTQASPSNLLYQIKDRITFEYLII